MLNIDLKCKRSSVWKREPVGSGGAKQRVRGGGEYDQNILYTHIEIS
jgi:hypothetical protein